jgi:pimeloyl-ACP methyl ester carboxylesterase
MKTYRINMEIIKNNIIQGKHNKPILIDFFYKKNSNKKPIVIFCHGYKGYKDWGSWNLVAEKFAEVDLFFVKFNFSHNGGTIEQPIDFPDLEAFGNNNFNIELDDLDCVLDHVLTNTDYCNDIDTSNIILIGHSRGGGVVTLKANEDARITKIISWAGISDIESRFPKGDELEAWKQIGTAYVLNSRTLQKMPNKYQVYENFMANKEQLHIQSAVKNLKIPYLIVHGSKDDVVLPIEAENLHKWNKNNNLLMVNDMNHSLGNSQPWQKPTLPNDMETVVNASINFIKL